MPKMMTYSLPCQTAFAQKYAGIDVDNATSIHDNVICATAVLKGQRSRTTSTEILEDGKKVMRLESIIEQSSPDICNEISTIRSNLDILTRAKVTKIVKSRMAKIQKRVKAKVVKTVVETFKDALQLRYSVSNDGLQSAVFNIVRNALTEFVRP